MTYLDDHLVVPDAACVDLADLDAAVEARAWGRASWKAFRALHAYGAALAEADPGTFWTWCERSGLWPATPKKLAMTESDTVQQDRRLRSRRMLPVARAVAPSGRVEMFAHVKVAEGGGTLIPRIYFHVDLAGARVHVGYFGPHRGMPNTLT
ncbi:MAG: hypothetical protein ACT4RN_08145 [Pseudonocardia sp.]